MAAAGGDFTVLSDTVAERDASLPLADQLGALRSRLLHDWQPPGGGAAGALSHAVIHSLDVTIALDRSISRLRTCWAVQAPAGCAVTPRMCTALVSASITNSTYTRWSRAVLTCRTSQARMPCAWAVRNCRHVGDARRGAGPSPAAARIRRIVPSPTR